MKTYFILVISVTILFTLIGCSPTTITITENSQKEKYSLKKGDFIEVILSANPSTGYEWQIVNIDTSKITILDETYIAKEVKKNIVGGGGDKTYLFKTMGKGNTVIELNYFRPFEKNLTPYKEFYINLDVR